MGAREHNVEKGRQTSAVQVGGGVHQRAHLLSRRVIVHREGRAPKRPAVQKRPRPRAIDHQLTINRRQIAPRQERVPRSKRNEKDETMPSMSRRTTRMPERAGGHARGHSAWLSYCNPVRPGPASDLPFWASCFKRSSPVRWA